jgi:Icc-related predicted phosphoesterase
MKIVAISDVHCKWNKLVIPPCDILISIGDYSFRGEKHVVKDYHNWLNQQEANHIISIQGNHELWVEKNFNEAKEVALKECPAVHFVEHELVEIEGIKIFCSAWSPYFCDWAYNGARTLSEATLYNKPLLKDLWKQIPIGTNIIATHTPVYEILDELVYMDGSPNGQFVGCVDLKDKVKEIKPDFHLSGHIHCGYGQKHIDGISYYNVSICSESYSPVNPITIINYEK